MKILYTGNGGGGIRFDRILREMVLVDKILQRMNLVMIF